MSALCLLIGHNWTTQTNEDGTGQWQQCARCGKERTTMASYGAKGWF